MARYHTAIAPWVNRHIAALQPRQLLTMAEVLKYGNRVAVNRALHRAIEQGRLERLAHGVFCKPLKVGEVIPVVAIADAKARAFGKHLHSTVPVNCEEDGVSFLACGRTTSFLYRGQKIVLKGVGNCWHMQMRREEIERKKLLPQQRGPNPIAQHSR